MEGAWDSRIALPATAFVIAVFMTMNHLHSWIMSAKAVIPIYIGGDTSPQISPPPSEIFISKLNNKAIITIYIGGESGAVYLIAVGILWISQCMMDFYVKSNHLELLSHLHSCCQGDVTHVCFQLTTIRSSLYSFASKSFWVKQTPRNMSLTRNSAKKLISYLFRVLTSMPIKIICQFHCVGKLCCGVVC